MKRASPVIACLMLGIIAFTPLAANAVNEPFYIDLVLRGMIFAIAAVSLDFILGYGGLVSLGHATYLGIGAYSVAILSYYGVANGFAHFGVAVTASALAAFLIGSVSLRTTGVYFIMVTLAFAQMVFFLSESINTFGGDDGISISRRSDFWFFNLDDTFALYYFTFVALIIVLLFGRMFIRSHFGRVIAGTRIDRARMAALGFPTLRYQMLAFVIAGATCGFAGALLANQNLFISPAIMHWTRSGEIMVMVIFGGVGTLFGAVLGALSFTMLEHIYSVWTTHWQLLLGGTMLAAVLLLRRGLWGVLAEDGK